MRKLAPSFILLITASLWAVQPVRASIFDFMGHKDKKPDLAPGSQDEAAAASELATADGLEHGGDAAGAIQAYRAIVKAHVLTASAAKAQYRIGRLQERGGDLGGAYKSYTEYLTKYPLGSEFDAVVQAQFNIAKLYLDGQKKRVLGVPISPQYQKAQEMFTGIVTKAPYHRLAPTAQFNVGQALEKQGKPGEAIVAYQDILTRYPNDPVADDAQYQIGYVQFRETQEGSNDQSSRQKAKEAFEDFVNRYPNSEKNAQAKENIKALGGTDVKGALEVARFYDKTKNFRAAVVYYNDVIKQAPGTPESDAAKKRIDELKSTFGADALRSGPEKAQTGAGAQARRRSQSKVDVASRPDFNGPPIIVPDEIPGRPRLRTDRPGVSPLPPVEPPLPSTDPLQENGAPSGKPPASQDSLLPTPTLPPPPSNEEVKASEKKEPQ